VCKSILPIRLVWGITTFSKKIKFSSSKKVNSNKVSKNKNIVHFDRKAKTCHYFMKRGHTSYKCYIRRFEFPRGKCVWIPKDLIVKINPNGPNLNWVPPFYNYFFLYVCLKARDSLWYLDSGCSRHMTGDMSKLTDFVSKEEGYVTFGDNNKGRIMEEGNIGN